MTIVVPCFVESWGLYCRRDPRVILERQVPFWPNWPVYKARAARVVAASFACRVVSKTFTCAYSLVRAVEYHECVHEEALLDHRAIVLDQFVRKRIVSFSVRNVYTYVAYTGAACIRSFKRLPSAREFQREDDDSWSSSVSYHLTYC